MKRGDRALNDPFERKDDEENNPRQLALEIIIKQYRDRPQTLCLLQDRAENDPDEEVREFAKKKFAEQVLVSTIVHRREAYE